VESGSARLVARRKEVGDGERKMNRYLHNQWQVDNFFTQEPVKAEVKALLDLYYGKAGFGQKHQ